MSQHPTDDVTLKIPRPLYEQLKQVIQESGFHSVTEFAVYVLRDLVSHHSAAGAAGKPSLSIPAPAVRSAPQVEAEPLSQQEIEAIRQRLESLGYL
jgi:4-aminobutyrate aminotransferase-like enzyme